MLIIRHSAAFVPITVSFKRLLTALGNNTFQEFSSFLSLLLPPAGTTCLYLEFISPVYILSEQMFHLTPQRAALTSRVSLF